MTARVRVVSLLILDGKHVVFFNRGRKERMYHKNEDWAELLSDTIYQMLEKDIGQLRPFANGWCWRRHSLWTR